MARPKKIEGFPDTSNGDLHGLTRQILQSNVTPLAFADTTGGV